MEISSAGRRDAACAAGCGDPIHWEELPRNMSKASTIGGESPLPSGELNVTPTPRLCASARDPSVLPDYI